jgi:hypothetical protein
MQTIIHHYTNIEVLSLILKNRTLRFNRLDRVDDPEESNFISNGVNLGPYTFVSCWTEAKEESIPMWKMYTKGNWGVRLSVVKEGLFKTYTEKDGFRHNGLVATNLGAPIQFLFPADVRYSQTKYTPPFLTTDYDGCGFYRKIEYVDDVQQYAGDSVEIIKRPNGQGSICIRFDKVGSYKNERWAFQEESRFVLNFMPGNSLAAFNTAAFGMEQNKMITSIIQNKDLGFSYYDMCLSDEAMENLVITMSPLSDSAQWAIVEALRDKYATKAVIRRSNLAGKLAR